MVLLPAGAPAAAVEGHFGYSGAIDRLWFRDAAATQVVPKVTSGTYAGNDAVNRAIPHGLATIPKIVFINDRGNVYWYRINDQAAQIYYITGAASGRSAVTAPSATNFYVGNAADYDLSANDGVATYDWVAIG